MLLAIAFSLALGADGPGRIERLEAWLSAVHHHQPGALDQHVITVAAWPAPQIAALWIDANALIKFVRCPGCTDVLVVDLRTGRLGPTGLKGTELRRLRDLADRIRDGEFGHIDALLKRAAFLHTDIPMRVPLEDLPPTLADQPAPSPDSGFARAVRGAPQRIVIKSKDGRQESIADVAVHWEIARALLALVGWDGRKARPAADPDVRRWFHATMAYMIRQLMHDPVHFDSALSFFPTAPEILFQFGCLHESYASSRSQAVIQTATLPGGIFIDVKSERAELQIAERAFRRAVELDPGRAEARLRFGRVLAGLGKHADAAAELRRVATDGEDDVIAYYTLIFLAAEEAILGRREEARAAYERALSLFPDSQSPRLGLSHLARQAGDRAGALRYVQQLRDLDGSRDRHADPWWDYELTAGRHADRLFDELYAPFRRKD